MNISPQLQRSTQICKEFELSSYSAIFAASLTNKRPTHSYFITRTHRPTTPRCHLTSNDNHARFDATESTRHPAAEGGDYQYARKSIRPDRATATTCTNTECPGVRSHRRHRYNRPYHRSAVSCRTSKPRADRSQNRSRLWFLNQLAPGAGIDRSGNLTQKKGR